MPPPATPSNDPSEPFPPIQLHRPSSSTGPSRQRAASNREVWPESWVPEDVERRSDLDDLNPRASPDFGRTYRIFRPEDVNQVGDELPPWRRRSTGEGEQVTVSVDPPPESSNSVPPPRDAAPPRNTVPAVPNPTRLAPYFSLDEILGAIRSRTSSPIDSNLRARSPRYRPPIEPYRRGDIWSNTSIDPNDFTRMFRSDSADSDGDGDQTPGSLSRRRPSRRGRAIPVDANGNVNLARPGDQMRGNGGGGDDGGGNGGLVMTRTNRRWPLPRDPNAGMNAVDPEEVLFYPDGDSTDDAEDDEPLFDFDFAHGAPVSSAQRGAMYNLGMNGTSEDLSVVGGSGGMNLSRGGYNRRRRRLVERMLGGSTDDGHEEQIQERAVPRSTGLEATNLSDLASHPAIIVRSGESRKRVGEVLAEGSKKRKRRGSEKTISEEKPQIQPLKRPSYLDYTTLDPSTPIPLEFDNPPHKRLELTRHFVAGGATRPCVTFTFQLPHRSDDDKHAAALRASRPIPVDCGIHYYEVEVLSKGEEGFISVGWMKANAKLDRLVGWDRGSWGWHADDGRSFECQGTGQPFGETWGKGDIVGCGIDFMMKKAFFTKNGKLVGYQFKNMGKGLFPAVGLRTTGESLSINFTGPFKYDVDNHVRNIRDTTWRDALREDPSKPISVPRLTDQIKPPATIELDEPTAINKDDELPQPIAHTPGGDAVNGEERDSIPKTSVLRDTKELVNASFVLDYLRHGGHGTALRHLKSDMRSRGWLSSKPSNDAGPSESKAAGVERKEYDEDSRLGDFDTIEGALKWLHSRIAHCDVQPLPWALIGDLDPPSPMVHRLEVQDFLYTLRQSLSYQDDDVEEIGEKDMQVLHKGQALRRKVIDEKWDSAEEKMLNEAIGLIGIEQARWESGRGRQISGEDRRLLDADNVVNSIGAQRGLKPISYLQQAFHQTHSIHRRLAVKDPKAAFVDVRRLLKEKKHGMTSRGGDTDKEDVKIEPDQS